MGRFLWSQNQDKILEYARSIVKDGYKPGLLIIDDTWQKDYGVWEFNATNFHDPKAMMKELHELGFLVSMWICPYRSQLLINDDLLIDFPPDTYMHTLLCDVDLIARTPYQK